MAEASTLYTSGLASFARLIPLDSTMRSVPPPPLSARAWVAVGRVVEFVRKLEEADAALIFTSDGWGLAEKALMSTLARASGKGVIVRLGSGNLPAQCAAHPLVDTMLRQLLRTASVVSVQGQHWVEFFASYPEARGKIRAMNNGVAIPAAPLRSLERFRGRIVSVGWANREKGIFEGLEAFARLHERFPLSHWTVVGGGRDLDQFRRAVAVRGLDSRVTTTGWVPHHDVFGILAESDIFFFPSHYEGMPNAVLEAMAAALPIVASRVGAVPQLVTPDVGELYEPRDVKGFEAALERLLTNPSLAVDRGLSARAHVEEYHIDSVWPKYAAAISDILRQA